MNWLMLLVSALIPLVIGFVWYNPKIGFGNAWMKASGVTEEDAAGGNMALIFGLTYVLSVLIAMALYPMVVHASAIDSLFLTEPGFQEAGSETMAFYDQIMEKVGGKHRTFGHGALHGASAALLFATPIFAINAMFERKGFKYIAVNMGYWIVSVALMGGVICQFA